VWFGIDSEQVTVPENLAGFTINYTLFSLTLILAWALALAIAATREFQILGAGAEEYKRVATASVQLFGIVAILGFALQIQFSRGYLLVALPVGTAALLAERWLWRQRLISVRRRGGFSARCIVVGGADEVRDTVSTLRRESSAGYRPIAVSVTTPGIAADLDLPLTPIAQILPALEEHQADTVIMLAGHGLSAREIREISWMLVPDEQHLIMVPSLVDVAGPRIHTRPVAGLPLVHVETPRYRGAGRFTKRLFDVIGSLVLLTVLSPLLLVAAIAVATTSPGPLLFRQERVGLHGKTFQLLKFRSMVVDADQMLGMVREQQDAGNEVLFKLKDDPRVTPVGRLMRRCSIDELPQLINVLTGTMSLVGPRPPLDREVEHYDEVARRRLLVRPGLTGLWQVSGRSTLSWEDSIRLDLFYVENWSLVGDVVLIWRTLRAVVARDGAY
jgi:exopolysaccharide biosynthesis polyprenyl glycosylphosphotransferase